MVAAMGCNLARSFTKAQLESVEPGAWEGDGRCPCRLQLSSLQWHGCAVNQDLLDSSCLFRMASAPGLSFPVFALGARKAYGGSAPQHAFPNSPVEGWQEKLVSLNLQDLPSHKQPRVTSRKALIHMRRLIQNR